MYHFFYKNDNVDVMLLQKFHATVKLMFAYMHKTNECLCENKMAAIIII